jgi:hypothetical protein
MLAGWINLPNGAKSKTLTIGTQKHVYLQNCTDTEMFFVAKVYRPGESFADCAIIRPGEDFHREFGCLTLSWHAENAKWSKIGKKSFVCLSYQDGSKFLAFKNDDDEYHSLDISNGDVCGASEGEIETYSNDDSSSWTYKWDD